MIVPPWLSHLRVDRRGRPVPYINRWGSEDVARLSVREDPSVQGRRAIFDDDSAETEPDFTAQNPQRQRECTSLGLCQVCARPVPWSRRFLVVSSISWQGVEVEGQDCVVITEPWLDGRCAAFALEVCPGLIRRRNAQDLMLVPITNRRQCRLVVSSGWFEGPLEAETRADPVVMWAKILVPTLVVVPALATDGD